MRIDVFFDAFPHSAKPNMETQLLEWRRQGHSLRIFSLHRIGAATSAFPVQFIRTLRERPLRLTCKLLWRAVMHPHRTRRTLGTGKHLISKLKRLATDAQLPIDPPDAYFIHNLAAAVCFSYLKHTMPTTPLAIYYHGGELPGVRQISPENSRISLQRADIVFSNTRASIDEVVARGADPARTMCAPTSFPPERFPFSADRHYIPNGQRRFVCVGRMAIEKGFDVVLQAFALLRQYATNFSVTFIGDGPELHHLKTLAEQLQLSDFVDFRGHLDSAKLIPVLGQFDVFVLSSRTVPGSNWAETQAAVMQEAMLMGTSVIASDMGGVSESLPSFARPYLYTPGSIDELVERLQIIMKHDEATLKALGKKGRDFVLDNYDIRKINARILSKLASITNQTGILSGS